MGQGGLAQRFRVLLAEINTDKETNKRSTQTSTRISMYLLFNDTFQFRRLFGYQCDENYYSFKGKVVPVHDMKVCEGMEVELH